ncbi:MAG: 30S ribosomal protein S17e [archaeon]
MGKIKSKLIRRTAKGLVEKGIEFTDSFEGNKKVLGKTMPSKKLRNQLAGFLAKTKKQEIKNQPDILKS